MAKKQKLAAKLAKLKTPPLPPSTKYDLRACLESMLASPLTSPDKWKPGVALGGKDDSALVKYTQEMWDINQTLFVNTDDVSKIEKYLTQSINNQTYSWSFTIDKRNCIALACDVLRQWNFEKGIFSLSSQDGSPLDAGFKVPFEDCAMWKEHIAQGGEEEKHFLKTKQRSAVLQFNRKGSSSEHFSQLFRRHTFQAVYNEILSLFRKEKLADGTDIDQKFALEYVHFIVFENKSVLFTHHQDSVANSNNPTVLTVICQLTGDKTSLRVLGAPDDAIYSGFGSCQAFPAEAFHRSGTNTTSTMKLVLGFKLRSLPVKRGVGADESEDVEPSHDTATPAAVASSSTDVAQVPEERPEAAKEEPDAEVKVKPETVKAEI